MTDYRGLYVVAQTPFKSDGEVDFDSVDTLSSFYYGHGAQGLTVLGVSGEAGKLSPDEGLGIVESFVRASRGRPIIAGVSNPSLAVLVELTREFAAAGAAAVMICPPSSVRTDEEILRYFDHVFQRIGDVPTVLQDFPFHSGVRMSVPLIAKLVERFQQIHAIKEEDLPSLGKITRLRQMRRRYVPILTGNNGLYLPQELARGADGPMAGFSYPEILSGVYRHMTVGEADKAHALFNRYLPLLRHEAQGEWGIAIRKEMMRRRGALACAAMRQPGPVLDATDLAELTFLVARMNAAQPAEDAA